MKIKCIVIDDEPRAHMILMNYSQRLPGVELLSTFLDGPSALRYLKSNKVDLIFLDITMPEMNGFDLIDQLSIAPFIVFTTAHSKFALKSYDYNAVDYLKKPFSFERFSKAIQKVAILIKKQMGERSVTDHINIKIDGGLIAVPFKDIRYFQSLGNYVKIITHQKTLLTQITTKEIEDSIPREFFVRIHKSYIVNKELVNKLTEDEVIVGEIHLPLGKTFKRYVLDSIR